MIRHTDDSDANKAMVGKKFILFMDAEDSVVEIKAAP
jgi:hypothetical protein